MTEDTRDKIKAALDAIEARTRANIEAEQRKRTAREEFEDDWRKQRDNIVIPAFNELSRTILEPRGWRCQVVPVNKDGIVEFRIQRGDMTAIGGRSSPCVRFASVVYQAKIFAHVSSMRQSKGEGEFEIAQVTPELVQEKVLVLLDRLKSET